MIHFEIYVFLLSVVFYLFGCSCHEFFFSTCSNRIQLFINSFILTATTTRIVHISLTVVYLRWRCNCIENRPKQVENYIIDIVIYCCCWHLHLIKINSFIQVLYRFSKNRYWIPNKWFSATISFFNFNSHSLTSFPLPPLSPFRVWCCIDFLLIFPFTLFYMDISSYINFNFCSSSFYSHNYGVDGDNSSRIHSID